MPAYEKKTTNMKSGGWVRLSVAVLLVVILLVALMNVAQVRSSDCVVVNQYATSDVVYADGNRAHFDDKNFGGLNKGDRATVHLALPTQPIFSESTLLFYDYNVVTEVWFGDTLLESYGADRANANMMLGNRYFMVAIPDEAWGSEITITVEAITDGALTNFTTLRVYPSQEAYRYFINVDPFGFICAVVLFVLGLVGIFGCLLARMRGIALANALCLTATMLLISLWFIANEGIYVLFGVDGYFWQPLEYIAGFTIAIPLLLFYRGIADISVKWRRVFGIAAIAVSLFFVIATILNFSGVLYYDSLMGVAGIFLVGSALLMLVYTVRMKTHKSLSKFMMKVGLCTFLPICIYELIVRVFYNQLAQAAFVAYYSPLLSLGVMLFVLCLAGSFFADLYDKQRDLLTVQVKADALDKVIAETPAGICRLIPDENLTIVSANDIFYEILGLTKDELTRVKPKVIIPYLLEAEKVVVRSKIDELLCGRSNQGEFEMSTVNPQNEPLTVMIRYFYDRVDSGNITINIIDITDRRQAEEELRTSEERYKLALNQSGKVFFFFDVPTRTMRLSQELADAFGLPLEVDNMPDNFIAQGLVEQESVEDYRALYERILAGEKSGETIISCHMRDTPDDVLWYRLAFTSIFDANNAPLSSIITYEDINEQHDAALSSRWKLLNLMSFSEKKYVIAHYDLTSNKILSQTGQMFTRMPAFVTGFDEINAFVLSPFIHEDDVLACSTFLDRQRLIEAFHRGKTDDSIEYRSLQSGSAFRWTSMAVSLVEDPYNSHVMAQLLFLDIHDDKTGEMKRMRDVEELKNELENSRIKIMMNQMQPHFLYNALSAIQTIIKIDPDYAYRLLYDFSTHLRSSIKALSSDAPIPFTEELNNIKAYLNIEKMRFGDKLKVVYEIGCDSFKVIPLSIQPLAENATRHGVYPRGVRGGTVVVRTYETEMAYVIEVEDDGAGFDMEEVSRRNSDSVGLKNLIFRLQMMMNADITVDSEIGKGTKVTVSIPKIDERSDGVSEEEGAGSEDDTGR